MDRPDSPLDGEKFARMYVEAFPQEDRARLLSILYGETRLELPQDISLLFFSHTLLFSDMTSKMYLNQVNCLVEFLKNGGDQQKVTDFLTLAEARLRHDNWPLSDTAEEVNRLVHLVGIGH